MDTARIICNLIIDLLGPVDSQFETEDYSALSYTTYQITIDFDIQYCRIHQSWILLKAIDLELYWKDPQKCSQKIIESLQETFIHDE
jgi:hypothetical protein